MVFANMDYWVSGTVHAAMDMQLPSYGYISQSDIFYTAAYRRRLVLEGHFPTLSAYHCWASNRL